MSAFDLNDPTPAEQHVLDFVNKIIEQGGEYPDAVSRASFWSGFSTARINEIYDSQFE